MTNNTSPDRDHFSAERSDAVRANLIRIVELDTRRRVLGGARRWGAGIALVAVGAGAGVGISSAAFAANSSVRGAVQAPADWEPGTPIIRLLGDKTRVTSAGEGSIQLPERPADATHVRISTRCVTVGQSSWTIESAEGLQGAGITCTEATLATAGRGYTDYRLAPGTRSITVEAGTTAETAITFQYVNQVATALGVNAKGQTYGNWVEGGEQPDLIPAEGTAPDGSKVRGYIFSKDIFSFSPDHPGLPDSVEQSEEWAKERDEKYPNGWTRPVYKSDGETVVGQFPIGGS